MTAMSTRLVHSSRFMRLANHCPDRLWWWFVDRFTDNSGWRPLSMREQKAGSR